MVSKEVFENYEKLISPQNNDIGFNSINYNGEPLTAPPLTTGTFYYTHIRGGLTGKHACLTFGDWCWQHAREDPLLAVRFILMKIKPKTSYANRMP